MKRLLPFFFFILCLTGTNAHAQAQDTLNNSSSVPLTLLYKIDYEIKLTEKQKEDVLKFLHSRSEQIEKVKTKEKPTKMSKEILSPINEEAYKQLEKILTDEQFNQLKKLREESRKVKEKYPAEQVYRSDQDFELDF